VKKIIALMTDYGYKDPYVGVLKGVIKSINPDAEIIDLTHGVERHNILEATVMLAVSARYFPRNTIFVVVVDPGVGGERKSIVIETNNYILVGPDNGCLSLLAEIDGIKRVFDVSNSRYRLPVVSSTFHGRDIFAPVAAWISRGIPLEEIGVELKPDEIVRMKIEKPRVDLENRVVEASILYIDVYGNIMTNIDESLLQQVKPALWSSIQISNYSRVYECKYVPSFSWVREGELACYINSWGYFEIAVFKGDASRLLGVRQGERLKLKFS
jgi:hypothetical protein